MTIGERIRQARTEKGLTQDKLGSRTGIHPKHIGKYETDKTMPSADKLKQIAEALEISSDYLLFDNAPKAGRVEINDTELLEKFIIIDSMSEDNREPIKDVIDALLLKKQVEGLVSKNK